MSLEELIAALEKEPSERVLKLGFRDPYSYRGIYSEVAFEPAENISVGEMLEAAKSALGTTYTGWKGGEFTMYGYVDCYLAFEGESSGETIGPTLLRLLLEQEA